MARTKSSFISKKLSGDKTKKQSKSNNESTEKPPRKPRRNRPGKLRTRQRIKRAQQKHPLSRAQFTRIVAAASGGGVRWSSAALNLLMNVINDDVQKAIVVTNAIMTHSKRKTLTRDHLEFGNAIVGELNGSVCL